MSASYQILSQDEVDELHNTFVAELQTRARKFIPDDAENNDYILSVLTDNLRAAARQRIKLDETALTWLVKPDLAKTGKPLRDVMRQIAKDPFSKQQHEAFEKAEAVRKDDPVIGKLFGDQKRIYLKCDVDVQSETRKKIAGILAAKGYTITSYKKGYATDAAGKQQFRIGRLLKDDAAAKKKFENDPARAGDTLVVISRDTMDIARMSTGRGWTSCQAANGMYAGYLPTQVRDGALIAYLVSSRDPDVNDPLARITIKSFNSREEQSAVANAQWEMDKAKQAADLRRGKVEAYNVHIGDVRREVEKLENLLENMSHDAAAYKSEAEAVLLAAADVAALENEYKKNHPVRKIFGTPATRERKAAERNAKNLIASAQELSATVTGALPRLTEKRQEIQKRTDELPALEIQAERAERKYVLLESKFNRVSARLEKTPNYAYAASKMYGMGNDTFRQVVESFIEEHLNKDKIGNFQISKGMYVDYENTTLVRKGKRPLRPAR